MPDEAEPDAAGPAEPKTSLSWTVPRNTSCCGEDAAGDCGAWYETGLPPCKGVLHFSQFWRPSGFSQPQFLHLMIPYF